MASFRWQPDPAMISNGEGIRRHDQMKDSPSRVAMDHEANVTSFGRYLNAVRMKKGIRLEDVSREIRVGLDALELIEGEDHARLPAEVYVRGFIKAYARSIGADAEAALRSYRESLYAHQRAGEAENGLRRHVRRFWLNLVLSFGGLFLTVVLTVSFFSEPSEDKGNNQAADKPARNGERVPVETPAVQKPEPLPTSAPGELVLIVTAIRDTRFKVVADNNLPEEKSIRAGRHVKLRANEKFNILLRDAGAVRMTLNDKPFSIFGASGQPANIEIP